MVWRNMNHLKHFETNYIWIYKALRNTWVQKEPLTSDSSLTKLIYKRGINIYSSCHTWKGFSSSLPSQFRALFIPIILPYKWKSVVILISQITVISLHVKSQLFPQSFSNIYSSKGFLFRAMILFTVHCQESA